MSELVFYRFVENKCQAAFAAVMTVFVSRHKHACATGFRWTLTTKTRYLSIVINLHMTKSNLVTEYNPFLNKKESEVLK